MTASKVASAQSGWTTRYLSSFKSDSLPADKPVDFEKALPASKCLLLKCGSDGRTYPNQCLLQCAQRKCPDYYSKGDLLDNFYDSENLVWNLIQESTTITITITILIWSLIQESMSASPLDDATEGDHRSRDKLIIFFLIHFQPNWPIHKNRWSLALKASI